MKQITASQLPDSLPKGQHGDDPQLQDTVARILRDVRERGDAALLSSARMYDAPSLQTLEVTEEEMRGAVLPEEHRAAIKDTLYRVFAFHEEQFQRLLDQGWDQPVNYLPVRTWWNKPGTVGQRALPVSSAGIYVPGGRAAYPSSVLMNASPACMLGIRVSVATPARPDGTLHPAVLAALGALPNVRAFKVGGAAAVAALAYGTETVPKVDVIAGPGNKYVNEAKRQLWGQVGLDGYAGPSEVCVLLDATSNAKYAAVDLLTQIEHAPDNVGYLVSTDEAKLRETLAIAEGMILNSERRDILRESWSNGLAVLARDLDEACAAVDLIAPEHLSLAVATPDLALSKIHHAGCILMGEWSPESAGDFAAGPSHTLPTGRAARFSSPVNVLTFLKFQSVIRLDRHSLAGLRPTIEAFAEMEGFPLHGYGATVRFEG